MTQRSNERTTQPATSSTRSEPGSRRTGTRSSRSREWWERLGLAGWAAPTLPTNAYGRGLSRGDAVLVQNAIAEFGALGAPGGLGLLLAAPTIATHGTPEQIEQYVRDIVTGQQAWCQLFSEPGAGSDLAGLQAQGDARRRGVDRQRPEGLDVGWPLSPTSACSSPAPNPDVPKHQGITYFAIDMHQPGVDVRPLREMTGRALFNEVFLTDARVPADAVIGGLNNGWAVANTTLVLRARRPRRRRRQQLGERRDPGNGRRPAGQSRRRLRPRSGQARGRRWRCVPRHVEDDDRASPRAPARRNDPTIRQDLVRLHTLSQIGRFNNLRVKAAKDTGVRDRRAWATSPSCR